MPASYYNCTEYEAIPWETKLRQLDIVLDGEAPI